MAKHKHWPEDHPFYARAPICPHPTKKKCDEQWTQFQHGHSGTPCIKEIQESKSKRGQMNKVATCTLVRLPESGMSFKQLLEAAGKD